jgi:DNA-binding protein HU-beta
MTIHSSLRGVDTLKGERSVLTRFERIQRLVKAGKIDTASRSAWGLPKVRTKFKVAGAKKAKAATEETAAAPAAAAAAPAGRARAGGARAVGARAAGARAAGARAGGARAGRARG